MKACKICGQPVSDRRELTARGKHLACGNALIEANARQLQAHSGPFFDHWRRRCAAAFGAVLLDDLQRAS